MGRQGQRMRTSSNDGNISLSG